MYGQQPYRCWITPGELLVPHHHTPHQHLQRLTDMATAEDANCACGIALPMLG